MVRLAGLRSFMRLLATQADRTVRLRLAASLLLALLGSLIAGLAPLALKGLIDALTVVATDQALPVVIGPAAFGAASSLHQAGLCAIAYLLALGLGRVLADLRPLLAGLADLRLHGRIAQLYHRQLLALPMAFHTQRRAGALCHGLSQATAGCQLATNSLMQGSPVVVELITVLVVLSHVGQPSLAAVFAISACAYAAVHAVGTARLRQHARAVSQAALGLQASLAESLMHIETLQSFQAQSFMQRRFEHAASALERRWTDLHRQRVRLGLGVSLVFTASVGLSLSLAMQAVVGQTLSIGGFVLATVCMLQMTRPLEQLGAAVRDAVHAGEFARPLMEVLDDGETARASRTPAADDKERDGRTEPMPGRPTPSDPACGAVAIRFDAVELRYGEQLPVLCGLTLDIPAGATVAIVGASGAGKSSVVRLLMRLVQPQAGRILWNQQPIEQLPIEDLRARIGYVPQDIALLNDSIAVNISLGRPGASRDDILAAAHHARLQGLLDTLPQGLDTVVGERGLTLSGGERQRIALARALLRRPSVYVLDEASSMLDATAEQALLRDLRERCDGATTLFITHRMAAARLSDLVVVLDQGRVVQTGSHAQLLSQPGIYRSLWWAQMPNTPGRSRRGDARARPRDREQSRSHCRRPARRPCL